jgi:outer membrane immunogenic protein
LHWENRHYALQVEVGRVSNGTDLKGVQTPSTGGLTYEKDVAPSAALAVLAVGPALAADLPRKAPPPVVPPPPVLSWTGFYVGLNAGAVWGCGSASNTVTNISSDANFPHGIGHPPPTTTGAENLAHLAAISSATSFD